MNLQVCRVWSACKETFRGVHHDCAGPRSASVTGMHCSPQFRSPLVSPYSNPKQGLGFRVEGLGPKR